LLPGLVCAVVAALASPAAALLASPPSDSEAGQVVAQAPAAGELFFGRMIYGVSGPEWGLFPPGSGWLVWGTMIAAFTVAALAHFSPSRQLGDEPVAGPDQAAAAADCSGHPAPPRWAGGRSAANWSVIRSRRSANR